jgi:hypothetical protein
MKVRSILAVLCLIAFFQQLFSTYLQENLKPLRAMAGLEELKAALQS